VLYVFKCIVEFVISVDEKFFTVYVSGRPGLFNYIRNPHVLAEQITVPVGKIIGIKEAHISPFHESEL
jgi:hypothetical protein